MLRYLTAGESHGKAIVAILEGMPAGLSISADEVNRELKRRQQGFGRGKRMQMENDRAQILSGLKKAMTLGSPIALLIENKDSTIETKPAVLCPRPGHADLAGLLKYGFTDVREVLERASARGTAATVAIGAICKRLLSEFKMVISSKVVTIGGESSQEMMKEKVAEAMNKKDTLGGIFEVKVKNVPVGLGSYAHPDRRLDGRITQSIMSIPGVKAVEIGLGFGYADKFGSQVHDSIYYSRQKGFFRLTNRAGGMEGGISNGEDILLRACMKPICTLMNPLDSVNIKSKKTSKASVERSDTCVVEAAGVVAEASVAFELARSFLEKFGADNLQDIKKALKAYCRRIKA